MNGKWNDVKGKWCSAMKNVAEMKFGKLGNHRKTQKILPPPHSSGSEKRNRDRSNNNPPPFLRDLLSINLSEFQFIFSIKRKYSY